MLLQSNTEFLPSSLVTQAPGSCTCSQHVCRDVWELGAIKQEVGPAIPMQSIAV